MNNELLKCGDSIIRILEIMEVTVLIVDCIHKSLPKWIQQAELTTYEICTEQELSSATGKLFVILILWTGKVDALRMSISL